MYARSLALGLVVLFAMACFGGEAPPPPDTEPAEKEEAPFSLSLPILCSLNEYCYVQNLPDLDPGEGVSDSFCEGATYDGHKGVDIRVISLKDLDRRIPVVAPAAGTIKALRDGEKDELLPTTAAPEPDDQRLCGNGVVITHTDGFETQLCHLRHGTIEVAVGDEVKRGQPIGLLGASGGAMFPHVHLTVRKDGEWLDPVSGRRPGEPCTDAPTPLFDASAASVFKADTTRLLRSGFSGSRLDHDALVKTGAAPDLRLSDPITIGWAWFINVRKGDQIRLALSGPGGIDVDKTFDALERHKATWSQFIGRKRRPQEGAYRLTTELLRDGEVLIHNVETHSL